MSDWPGDTEPLPRHVPEDRMAGQLAAYVGSWRPDRPNVEPQFFDGPIEAIVEADLKGEHVIWFDSFDYARYNRGRVA